MNSFNRILYLALAVYVAVLLYKGWTSGQVMTRRRPPGKRYGLVDRGEAPRSTARTMHQRTMPGTQHPSASP